MESLSHQFANIPQHLVDVAIRAVNGSVPDFFVLMDALPDLSELAAASLIPILRPHIKTTYLTEYDPDSPHARTRLLCALASIEGMGDIASRSSVVPYEVVQAWPAIRALVGFIDSLLDKSTPITPIILANHYRAFARLLRAGNAHTVGPLNTDGLLAIIGKAWSCLLQVDDSTALMHLSDILYYGNFGHYSMRRYELELFVEGVGGGWAGFARNLCRHIRKCFPDPRATTTTTGLRGLRGILHMLNYLFVENRQFRTATLDEGLLSCLTTAIRVLGNPPVPLTSERYMQNLCSCVDRALNDIDPAKHVIECLHAGILDFVFSPSDLKSGAIEMLKSLLGFHLPSATVYLSVLSELYRVLLDFRAQELEERLRNPFLVDLWRRFLPLLDERLQAARDFERGDLSNLRACDNYECNKVDEKTCFRPCTTCMVRVYCSEECQLRSWNMGHHKWCAETKKQIDADSQMITPKDRSFLRALLNREFARNEEAITIEVLHAMLACPGQTLQVIFSYESGWCKVRVECADKSLVVRRTSEDLCGAWDDPERTSLHFIELNGGRHAACVRFSPLRRDSPAVHRGLQEIAARVPTSVVGVRNYLEPYRQDVRRLLETPDLWTHC